MSSGEATVENKTLNVDYSNCIVPLLESIGWKGDHLHLMEAMPYPKGKMDLSDLMNTMANLQYESEMSSISLNELREQDFPCFFVNHRDEAYVLLSVQGGLFLAFDGSSGEYLELKPEKIKGVFVKFKKIEEGKVSLLDSQKNWFLKVLSRFKKIIWLGFILSVFLSLLAIASPVLIIFVYSQIQTKGPEYEILMVGGGVLLYVIAEITFKYTRNNLFIYIGSRLSYVIGNQVIRRILYLPPSFTQSPAVSTQISRIKEFENIREFFSGASLTTLFDTFLIILLIIGLAIIGGELVYIPIAAIIIFIAFGLSIRSVVQHLAAESSKSTANRQEMITEMTNQYRDFKTSGIGKWWLKQFKNLSVDKANKAYETAKVNALIANVSHFLISSSGILTVCFGVLKVLDEEMSMGALMGVMLITFRILTPLKGFFNTVGQFENVLRSIKQIDRFMSMDLEVYSNDTSASVKYSGHIIFKNVSLRYLTDHHPALINVNLTIQKGECVILCGPGGSGRSSILRVLMRLVEAQSGQVFVDHINIRQLNAVNLRYSYSYVPVQTQFYKGTLLENLKCVQPHVDDEAIDKALKDAGLYDEIISMEKGLETFVYPENIPFSDTFKKKFGFARAFLRETNILLLDKPEYGLSEKDIHLMMEQLQKRIGVSTIIIASNNKKFFSLVDRAILMEGGRITKADKPEVIADLFYNKAKS